MTMVPIMRACEGSNLVGHAFYAPTIGTVVICQMCGGHFESMIDGHDQVPLHDRKDIIAMVERGDFG